MPRNKSGSAGFSVVELLVTMVVLSILGASLSQLFFGQLQFQRTEDAIRDSRSAARAALNVLQSDMRMLEGAGAVVDATPRVVTLRVPYSFGVVCRSNGGETDIGLLPSDPTTYDGAGFSGWAWRNPNTGAWVYRDGVVAMSEPGPASCAANAVRVLAGGRVVRLSPGLNGLSAGTPVMLFQTIQYSFDNSMTLPGRTALYRTVMATEQRSELVSPFAPTARFRFHTDWAAAQDAPPADLTTIVGLEVNLDAQSVSDSPRRDEPEAFSLITSIFFKNASG